ncbi:hypothetical protein HanRHA438_Chr01g0009821 [Helianthus annuus]|nr:hypothetical protein HanRHA438_Chr01g0009821 [Helianthus annuus]
MIQIHRNQCWWCFNGEGGGVTAFNDEKQKRQRERERERERRNRERVAGDGGGTGSGFFRPKLHGKPPPSFLFVSFLFFVCDR